LLYLLFFCLFVCFIGFICCIPLPQFTHVLVLVTQYTCEITFNGDPDFVASVPQTKGPAFSKALSPHAFVSSLYFGLSKPSFVCISNFLL
jgi:hypothetical protein